jgi:hypothetical protein
LKVDERVFPLFQLQETAENRSGTPTSMAMDPNRGQATGRCICDGNDLFMIMGAFFHQGSLYQEAL